MLKNIKKDIVSPGVQVLRRDTTQSENQIPIVRVAAYCRVSTDKEIQQTSLDTQVETFKTLIASHPGWELVGVYADEGLSGTTAEKRVEFQRMIADCEAGKIDYIVTKSISRFARNTMDCLQYVRRLKELGVNVLFDENNLDTAGSSSEMLLSILAAVAQEESHSISENMKWGMRKRFAEGRPKWSRTFGYVKDADGNFQINEKEAVVVRRIFRMYAEGCSLPRIVGILNTEGIPSASGGRWWTKTVAEVLHNEKHVGDVVMQKCYTVDFLTHRKIRNDQTVVPSYKVKDHHEPIIDRKTFDMVQTIASMRNTRQGCMQYPYYGTLICPFCGAKMIGCHLPINSNPGVWTCGGERDDIIAFDPFLTDKPTEGTVTRKSTCQHYAVRTKYIDRIVKTAYAELNIDDLKCLAEKHSALGRAAAKALKWKEKDPDLARVEYIFLDDLVESISFHTTEKAGVQWDKGVVNWKFGVRSFVPITYDKPGELPYAKHTEKEYKWIGNAQQHNSSIQNCCKKVREQDSRPHPFQGGERTAQNENTED